MATSEKLSLKPLGDRVLILPDAAEEKTAMGILLPDTAKRDAAGKGVVVAVGPGRFDDGSLVPMTLKAGDHVLFSKYAGEELRLDGKDYHLLPESSVLAIL